MRQGQRVVSHSSLPPNHIKASTLRLRQWADCDTVRPLQTLVLSARRRRAKDRATGVTKNEDKNGLGARAKQLKSRKAGPDNERGAWETSARSTCG